MIVRSALMISARVYDDSRTAQLVASPEEFDSLKEALNDTRIGGFGRIYTQQGENGASAQQAIAQFYHNREHHELLLLYISGFELIVHNDKIYFIDQDTDMDALEETAIPADFVRKAIGNCRAEQKILLLDCFSRSEMDQTQRNKKEERLANFSQKTNCTVLTSQDTLETIRSGEGKKNPGFTESIINGLSTGDADLDGRGYITEDELFLHVYKNMSQHGTAPNLFLSANRNKKHIQVAKNIKFSSLPEYATEDDTLNFARFIRLISKQKNSETEQEKETFRKVIRFQPEVTFIKRMLRAVLVASLFSTLAAWITNEPIGKAISIAVIVLFGLIADDLVRRKFS